MVMENKTKAIREIATEISEQAVIFALNTDFALIEDKNSVSNVLFSFSPTKTQAADATEQTIGTMRNSKGHSSVVNASIQNWLSPALSFPRIARKAAGIWLPGDAGNKLIATK